MIASTGAKASDLRLGPGNLAVQSGGTLLASYYSYLNGALLVEGTGSEFRSGVIDIGYGGVVAGGLTIRGGGVVSCSMGYLEYVQNGASSATVEGEGSRWEVGGLMANYGSVLTVRDQGVVGGTGNFSVSGAAVTVAGAGSRIDHEGNLAVTGGTTSLVSIEAGGAMTTGGTATMDGSEAAELLVSGRGSSWTSGGGFTLHNGRLRIREGAEVRNASVSIERQGSLSVGKVLVQGAGTKWNLDDGLVVKGDLEVSGGASVASASGYLFNVPVVAVVGGGSTITASGNFEVQGNLSVSQGAQVQSALGTIGSHYRGAASVSGAGSAWLNTDDLRIGCSSVGELAVLDGAEVICRDGYLGYYGSGTSTARVSGTGARWRNRGDLYVGYYSSLVPGVVTISAGGRVEVDGGAAEAGAGTVYLGYGTNTTGTLNIGEGGAAGSLKAAAMVFRTASGRLVFNHTDAAHIFSASISGPGSITHQAGGQTILSGEGSGFSGSTTVSAGTLLVSGTFGTAESPVGVSSGATLGGSGSLGVVTLNAGAKLSPGGDGGDAKLGAASLRWPGGASVEMDLGAAANSDKIVLSGALTKLAGSGFSFRFRLGPDYVGPTTYDIVTFGSTNFTAADFSTSGPVTGTFQLVGGTLRFMATAQRPTIAVPAVASPPPAGATTVALSVLGADSGGEANLVYEWDAAGPAEVSFSPNKSNAAKNATATFEKAGVYVLTAKATNASGASATSSVSVTVGQRFEWWGVDQGLTGDGSAPQSDPDADGVVNLLEYALGANPKVPDVGALPSVRVEGADLVMAYSRVAGDVVYQPEWSDDLVEWRTEGVSVSREGDVEIASLKLAGDGPRFLRLKVWLTP